ncbi:MAG TPA: hypothetical protein VNT20_16645 [Flavisolibacter sp.]|jgi:hypothetical protein|nr:hypothetical protein [Flavisolibacter sp.]
MHGKQHIGFKSRLLAVLFLFFNCICTAAPIVKLAGEDYADTTSIRLIQIANPLENEEEKHAIFYWHVNQFQYTSVRKIFNNRMYDAALTASIVPLSASDVEASNTSIPDASVLPVPGNYAFLFRYSLF